MLHAARQPRAWLIFDIGQTQEKRTVSKAQTPVSWSRVLAGSALWAVVYHLVWGVAWFAFMHREWEVAATAVGRPMPMTAEVWIITGILTLPLAAVILKYASDPARSALKASLHASAAMWAILTVAMAILCMQRSFSARIIVADSVINLIAMLAASVAGTWTLGDVQEKMPNKAPEPTPTAVTPPANERRIE